MSVVRGFVVIVYAIAFFVALWSVSTAWSLIDYAGSYVAATVIFTLLVALCGVLISFFVYIDGEEIDKLRELTGLAEYEEEELKSGITLEEWMKRKREARAKDEDA